MEQLLELLNAVAVSDGTEPVDLSNNPAVRDVIKKAIAHGAKTEKDKLYPDLTQAKNRVKELEAQVAGSSQTPPAGTPSDELATLISDLKTVLAKSAAPQTPPANGEPAAPGAGQSVGDTDKFAQIVSAAFNKVLPQYLGPIQSKLEALEKDRVEQYRAQKISELGDFVSPELITGDTIEEIDRTAGLAKAIAEKFKVAQPAPPATPAPPGANPAPPVPPVAPPAGLTTPPADTTRIPDARKMSPEEYARQRTNLMQTLKETYQ